MKTPGGPDARTPGSPDATVPRPADRTGHEALGDQAGSDDGESAPGRRRRTDQANASIGGQAHTRLRSPYAWSMRRTGGQYFRPLMPGSG